MPAATTILAAASIGASAGGSTMSFIQAAQANKAAQAARADAEKFVSEARQRLSRNAYAALSLPMQQYEMQREELARAVGQAGEVARTAERGAPETATAAIMAANQGARQIGAVAEQAMSAIEQKEAAEQSRLDTAMSNIALAQAEGAAKAYRDEMNARNAAISQGAMQAASALGSAANLAGDYDARKSAIDTSGGGGATGFGKAVGTEQVAGFEIPAFQAPTTGGVDVMSQITPAGIMPGQMTPAEAIGVIDQSFLAYDKPSPTSMLYPAPTTRSPYQMSNRVAMTTGLNLVPNKPATPFAPVLFSPAVTSPLYYSPMQIANPGVATPLNPGAGGYLTAPQYNPPIPGLTYIPGLGYR